LILYFEKHFFYYTKIFFLFLTSKQIDVFVSFKKKITIKKNGCSGEQPFFLVSENLSKLGLKTLSSKVSNN
jgi:hypothetical protein